jgi:putative ABC transport system permease protein
MWRVALRNIGSHKVRLALTLLTIVLGIAFITGTYVFTDSLKKQFDDLVAVRAADVSVAPASDFAGLAGGSAQQAPTMSEDEVATVAAVPGVAAASPVILSNNVLVIGSDGEPVSRPGPPTFGQSWPADPEIVGIKLDAGRPPAGSNEVALLGETAKKAGVSVGDTVTIDTPKGGTINAEVSGLVSRGISGGVGGTLVLFDLPTAQKYLTGPGQITGVDVTAQAGRTPDQVADALEEALGPDFTVSTAKETADALGDAIGQAFSFINTFLLAFGLIALFVSAFLIFNTFSMLVAQRSRELALLRAVGATRRQVRFSVVLEAVILGLVASTLGMLVGLGVSQLLRKLFALVGAELPGGQLVVQPRTIALAYLVGVLITLVSSLLPARRASRVPPVAAMRDDASPSHASLVRITAIGAIGLVVAAALAWVGLDAAGQDTTKAASFVGLSAVIALISIIAMAPTAGKFAIGVLGAPIKRGVVGRIAVENGRRNPRRTAATASALAIGLALMSAIGVIAASARESISGVVDSTIGADFIVLGKNFQPFSTNVEPALAAVPGIRLATNVQQVPIEVGGARNILTGVDPAAFSEVVDLTFTAGSLAGLGDNGVIVDSKTADAIEATIGKELPATLEQGDQKLTVRGIYEAAGFYTGYITSLDNLDKWGSPGVDTGVYLMADPDVPLEQVRDNLDAAMKKFPAVKLQDQGDLKAEIDGQFNQLFGFIYALLALAVLVAFLGIVNTLSLSVFERTREVGLLRAVGTSRRQIRRMLLIESVLIAIFGATTGLIIGLVYGTLLRKVLEPEGITVLVIPWSQVLFFLALGAVGGVLAAAWPAARAARLDVLRAIATE